MKHIKAIALTTFRESVRSKVLYSIIFFAILLVAVSAFFGTVTIGDQIKVIKDFGLFSISLFSVTFAVISGSSLLAKELSKKTVYNILSKPVARWEFLVGKYFGMLATVFIMIALMGAGLLCFTFFFEGSLDVLLFQAFLSIFFELLIICAAAIFFSSIVVTPMLSGLFTFGIFLAGRSTEHLLFFISTGSVPPPVAAVCKGLYAILPHLDKISISDSIVYGKGAGVDFLASSFLYAAFYSAILIVLANFIFKRREFN